ncbi:MAG: DUF1223 domain-containing protein [Blastocatellia bacterium]
MSCEAVTRPAKTPVIVELFTSEGCSSCPPADAVLAELERQQPVANAEIIALSEHVDYWNYLGWADPFSAPVYSARQQEYARSLGADVYTPQMIVQGRTQLLGSQLTQAREAITQAARAPQANVQIKRLAPTQIEVTATELPKTSNPLDIVLAITENNLSTNVARGENAGRRLPHVSVVRQLQVIGTAPTATAKLTFAKNWQRDNLRLVAFLQERKSRRIVGAAVLAGTDLQP